jgi:hypothetical protein
MHISVRLRKGERMSASHITTTVHDDRESVATATTSNDGITFEIDRQSGANISNIGGDQTIYYGDRSRSTRIGKIVAALGLVLSLVGFALLVIIGVMTAHRVLHDLHAGGVQTPYTHYVPSYWPIAAGLLVGGFVFRRFARILLGR